MTDILKLFSSRASRVDGFLKSEQRKRQRNRITYSLNGLVCPASAALHLWLDRIISAQEVHEAPSYQHPVY